MATTFASYQRLEEDWTLQKATAIKEITQMDKQILAAKIQEAVSVQLPSMTAREAALICLSAQLARGLSHIPPKVTVVQHTT